MSDDEHHDEHHDFNAENADAGASTTYPQQSGTIRKNAFIVLKGRPCKVVETSTSKTGKHGHAKVHFVGIDIFTGKKYEDICPSSHNMDVPNVKREDYSVVDIEDGFVSLMDGKGAVKSDLKVPEGEIGDSLKKQFEEGKELVVSVVSAMNEEMILSVKEAPK
mmetsp:Transcript_46428/g.75784  ORF Transcript_46428/g.75784 Transcript_46428/m.75784 type:complete len:163 (+) Transcript_46428:126-614(+)|eukprot:CAMPEP_0184643782 /NCGR_PEP_ID=MMETSP0308-20130426/607_1 /TAXON_ID=38269 /ORGANISM="Gloeochaete witrockiana, Strain SAG 46.84" /LENGTH=162 /DNA_ID=CAMNT_0027071949 /DNA_START=124 /DNA_END=612 /DNA_ORIENTATION=+